MTNTLFLITGGGTGAKVAEAFVHLCAAGSGPKEAHILLVDSDTNNGNLQRAERAVTSYKRMQRWSWSVQADLSKKWYNRLGVGGESIGTHLFETSLQLHRLTRPIKTVIDGGLRNVASQDKNMTQVLDLLYDAEEQQATCEDGFRARPNLGCLLLSDHLNEHLEAEVSSFLDAIANTLSARRSVVPIVVAASVFGGTGASLLPVIRGCVERAFENRSGVVETGRLNWGAVKMLPHYQPDDIKESVDPDRFLLDAASALQYYSTVYRDSESRSSYDDVYLVGSDNPARNRVEVELGHNAQSNPAYFEEFLAALAVVDASKISAGNSRDRVRLFHPDIGRPLRWTDLPHSDAKRLRNRFAYLLHLASFYLRQGMQQLEKGGSAFWQDVPPGQLGDFAWYDALIDRWASHNETYKKADRGKRARLIRNAPVLGELSVSAMKEHAAEYFGRLLLWADTALTGTGLSLMDYRQRQDYAMVYQAMNHLRSGDVDTVQKEGEIQEIQPENDNALIRFLRGALVSMMRLHNRDVRLKVDPGQFNLVEENGRIPLAISRHQIETALQHDNHPGIEDAFTRTHVQ